MTAHHWAIWRLTASGYAAGGHDGREGVHLVSAFASPLRAVVSQMRVEPGANEITTAPGLLKTLPLVGGKASCKTVYIITSLTREKAPAAVLFALNRQHWSIENTLHWRRDTGFAEDPSTIRGGNAPQALAGLRNAVLRLLQPFPNPNTHRTTGLRRKQITRHRPRPTGLSLNGPGG